MSSPEQQPEDSTLARRAVLTLGFAAHYPSWSSFWAAHYEGLGASLFALMVLTHFLGGLSWPMLVTFSSHCRSRSEFWLFLPYCGVLLCGLFGAAPFKLGLAVMIAVTLAFPVMAIVRRQAR